jgi:hypothetical protein
MECKIYANVQDMFDAIRDENGVLHPTQFTGDVSKLIRLPDLVRSPDNPDVSTAHSSDK